MRIQIKTAIVVLDTYLTRVPRQIGGSQMAAGKRRSSKFSDGKSKGFGTINGGTSFNGLMKIVQVIFTCQGRLRRVTAEKLDGRLKKKRKIG